MRTVKFNTTVFAEMILAKRKWSGLRLRELAKEVGVSAATLSRAESGYLPDLLTCKKICNWLNLDIDYFFNK